jgi:hypothetical protein
MEDAQEKVGVPQCISKGISTYRLIWMNITIGGGISCHGVSFPYAVKEVVL